MSLMVRARVKAALHIWMGFRPGNHRIWRYYRYFGFDTLKIWCTCGKEFR